MIPYVCANKKESEVNHIIILEIQGNFASYPLEIQGCFDNMTLEKKGNTDDIHVLHLHSIR